MVVPALRWVTRRHMTIRDLSRGDDVMVTITGKAPMRSVVTRVATQLVYVLGSQKGFDRDTGAYEDGGRLIRTVEDQDAFDHLAGARAECLRGGVNVSACSPARAIAICKLLKSAGLLDRT